VTAIIDTYLQNLCSMAKKLNHREKTWLRKIPQNSGFHVHSCSVHPGEVCAVLKCISGKTWIAP
jgi:hypothetical protein